MNNTAKSRPLILAVDDDLVSLQLAEDRLGDEGFEVIVAADGKTALSLFVQASVRGRPFDVVLLDVEMPGMDGYQVCQQIRGLNDGLFVSIIMISAREDIEAARRAYAVRATDFSSKPTNWLVLAERLRYVLRAASTFNELKRNQQRLADAQRTAKLDYWEFDPQAEQFYFVKPDGNLQTIEHSNLYSFKRLLHRLHPADRGAMETYYKKLTSQQEGMTASIEFRVLDIAGDAESFLTFHSEARRQEVDANSIKTLGRVYGVTQDITEIRDNEERIQRLAHYDELTGLHNRSSFQEKLNVTLELNKASQGKLALFLVDLDGFKRINESFGHSIGDALIQAFVQRSSSELRSSKIIDRDIGPSSMSRFGGDEFSLMINCDKNEPKLCASRVAELIKDSLARPFYIGPSNSGTGKNEIEIMISASIGIAIYPDDGESAELLLSNADTALHSAKQSGKNQHQFYNDAMSATGRARLDLETELRRAIDGGQLELYYQPQVLAASGKLVGVEALVRWNHPERGLVSPAEFIPLAEESGLILPMSDWIMNQACRQTKTWVDSGLEPFMVSINLSGMQFRQSDFKENVQKIIQASGVDPQLIGLELTESVVMGDAENTIATLLSLKELGVKLSIDDFGTGYSSLSYLQKFPLDTLKIDRSFIMDIGEDSDDSAITEAIIVMGHSLGLQIIAEGVETQVQLDFLRERSCEVIQGFFFSRPLPANEIPSFADKHRNGNSHP
ncbi:MAG: EAL domain-containing protein [Porticoccaceae bacterium]|nr:EAL domain-containing protein [Porticoccaceae bacterium]